MRTQRLWLPSAVLAVGILVLASPAPLSAINTCATICDCSVNCATECLYGQIVKPEYIFEIFAENCGEYGVCIGKPACPPNPECPALNCTTNLYGTSGGDTINGTAARECIWGYDGNDTIDGKAGDDQVWAGTGTDTVYGDSGNDCLYGQGGNDHLDGGSGNDLVDGGGGTDTCYGEIKVSCP